MKKESHGKVVCNEGQEDCEHDWKEGTTLYGEPYRVCSKCFRYEGEIVYY